MIDVESNTTNHIDQVNTNDDDCKVIEDPEKSKSQDVEILNGGNSSSIDGKDQEKRYGFFAVNWFSILILLIHFYY